MTLRIVTCLLLAASVSGCAVLNGPWDGERRAGASTPLVDYLYPDGEIPSDVAARVPQLELPLRVGLAFIPARGRSRTLVDAASQTRLLNSVRNTFSDYDYIEHIEIIPSTYLRGYGGTSGLRQIAALHGVDVMALVSYDQVGRTYENTQSLMYWTIVGAYVFEGTDHDTRTFIDLAVIDAPTGKLLLRAPGFDERRGDTTLVDANRALQNHSERGFHAAFDSLNQNLTVELARFEERLKAKPKDIQVSWRGGGGALHPLWLWLLPVTAVVGVRRARHRPPAQPTTL